MRLFDIFKKKGDEDTSGRDERISDIKALEMYSGMRVVVETPEEQMLFIAKIKDLKGSKARLLQYSDADTEEDLDLHRATEHMFVKIRGYNERERKAVLMEGIITPGQKHVWEIDELKVTRVENERAFFRLNTDLDAVILPAAESDEGRQACKLLNISIGGAGIGSEHRYYKGDRFLLKVSMLADRPPSVMFCEVLRVIEKKDAWFEYGCQFLELTEADQEQIAKDISVVQRKRREGM
ncbi:MAG: PilZ domain-containing protein [Lachnospiraceae bacterium]